MVCVIAILQSIAIFIKQIRVCIDNSSQIINQSRRSSNGGYDPVHELNSLILGNDVSNEVEKGNTHQNVKKEAKKRKKDSEKFDNGTLIYISTLFLFFSFE